MAKTTLKNNMNSTNTHPALEKSMLKGDHYNVSGLHRPEKFLVHED